MGSHKGSILLPVTRHRSLLIYALEGLSNAMKRPYGAVEMVQRLNSASDHLRRISGSGRGYELLIWDAYRTPETQAAIYERYVRELMKSDAIDWVEAYKRAAAFVSVPTSIFPHGTGGAVDLTLLIDGKPANMGTDFDAFVPEASADWFHHHQPTCSAEEEAALNREILRGAMESVGFVPLDSEWWHYEWGTVRWSHVRKCLPILDRVLPPPDVTGSALTPIDPVHKQPVWYGGVAHLFPDSESRAAALRHEGRGHYYARFTHPSCDQLSNLMRHQIIPAEYCALGSSGLAVCRAVFDALVPPSGCIIYDKFIYYEVERVLLSMAERNAWTALAVDLRADDFECELEAISEGGHQIHLIFADSPRNWWLECLDVCRIAEASRRFGARLAIDVSVQPIQDLLHLGVDAVVCSLSKYPSLGLTLGGVVLTDDHDISELIQESLQSYGNALSPDSAVTIWSQAISLKDRIAQLSLKTVELGEMLVNHPAVTKVRYPEASMVGWAGGQFAFHATDFRTGSMAEKFVGYNAGRTRSGLHLACTFGASMTTFEHFASNIRKRTGIPREATNEVVLPDDIVRIGVGCEDRTDIAADLRFVLDMAMQSLPRVN